MVKNTVKSRLKTQLLWSLAGWPLSTWVNYSSFHQGLSVLLRKIIVRSECDTSCAWGIQDFLPIQQPFPCALLFSYSHSPRDLNGDCLSISGFKDGHLTWAWPVKTIHLLATANQLRMGTFPNSDQSGQIGPNSSYFLLLSLNYRSNRTSVQNRWQPQEVNLPKKEANQKITDENPEGRNIGSLWHCFSSWIQPFLKLDVLEQYVSWANKLPFLLMKV